MESKEELMSEVLKRVQRNYVHMAEIERMTKELGDALSRNDQESAQLLIKMRQEEMDLVSETKGEIRLLIQASGDEQEKLLCWLKGENAYPPDSFEEKKIVELSGQLLQILNRTIERDRMVNSKVAGKDSYYQSAQ